MLFLINRYVLLINSVVVCLEQIYWKGLDDSVRIDDPPRFVLADSAEVSGDTSLGTRLLSLAVAQHSFERRWC